MRGLRDHGLGKREAVVFMADVPNTCFFRESGSEKTRNYLRLFLEKAKSDFFRGVKNSETFCNTIRESIHSRTYVGGLRAE